MHLKKVNKVCHVKSGKKEVISVWPPLFISLQTFCLRAGNTDVLPQWPGVCPDGCIVGSTAVAVGVVHNLQQCWGHVSLGIRVWLAANVMLRDYLFLKKMHLELKQSCDPLVINYSKGKKNSLYESSPFTSKELEQRHTGAYAHTNWKWPTGAITTQKRHVLAFQSALPLQISRFQIFEPARKKNEALVLSVGFMDFNLWWTLYP